MTSSDLYRKLLYSGYTDITDYLKDSPTNRYIYKCLLHYSERYGINNPILDLFNEIYFQCIRIQCDSVPGENIEERYLKEEDERLGSRNATMLVFVMVWALFMRKRNLAFNEDCFIKQMRKIIHQSNFMTVPEDLLYFMANHRYITPDDFYPMPCPVHEIPLIVKEDDGKKDNPWRVVTENYSFNVMERLLALYTTIEDQNEFLTRIEKSSAEGDVAKYDAVFSKLRERINAGTYLHPASERSYVVSMDENFEPYDFYENIHRHSWEEKVSLEEDIKTDKIIERYQNEIKSLKEQLQSQGERYEQQIESREHYYQWEIKELKSKMERLSKRRKTKTTKDNTYIYFDTIDGIEEEVALTVSEMVVYVKERFSKQAAEEFINMYWHLISTRKDIDSELSELVGDILPAIIERDAPHQTFEINDPVQVYINPSKVVNKHEEK